MKLAISLISIQILFAASTTARLQVPLVSIAPAKNPTSLLDASAVATLPGLDAPDIRVGQVSGPAVISPATNAATTLPEGALWLRVYPDDGRRNASCTQAYSRFARAEEPVTTTGRRTRFQ
jgi:hypothetical protein